MLCSVETWAMLESLGNARIDFKYSNLINQIYNNASILVKIDD